MQAIGTSSRSRPRRGPWLLAGLAAGTRFAALTLFLSCLPPAEPADVYVTVDIETDSLQAFDTVLVVLFPGNGSGAPSDTLWNGRPPQAGDLDRVKVEGYAGGDVKVVVTGRLAGRKVYEQHIDYRGGTAIPTLVLAEDIAPPVLSLRDSVIEVAPGGAVPDSFAVCRDQVDGTWATPWSDSLVVSTAPTRVLLLTYVCTDKAGNRSAAGQAVLRHLLRPDTVPPRVVLRGAEAVTHPLSQPYVDAGADCIDDRDAPVAAVTVDTVDVRVEGTYRLRFRCVDDAGNVSPERVREVKVGSGSRFDTLPAARDALLDTVWRTQSNFGATPVLRFGKAFPWPDNGPSLLAFELDSVGKAPLKSAHAEFHTFLEGATSLDSLQVVFTAHRILLPWIEGTGNAFWHTGDFREDGQKLLQHHPLRAEIKAKSTDPESASGVTGITPSVARIQNTTLAGKDTVAVRYGSLNSTGISPAVVPPKHYLVKVRIDVTAYVRNPNPEKDYGLILSTEGVPENCWIGWATRELGDGSLGPRLILEY